jgi:hypothetical protein
MTEQTEHQHDYQRQERPHPRPVRPGQVQDNIVCTTCGHELYHWQGVRGSGT